MIRVPATSRHATRPRPEVPACDVPPPDPAGPPGDPRSAAAARLLQALWREDRGWPAGTLDTPQGPVPLGSRLRQDYARAGANLLSREVARHVRLELAYRPP